ncbi:MAG TPA: hypothetical protein VFN57_04655 [Thermomicrobiaceae bacterium]|nr:hypothetical protein [Thermomicrobiaceae bacterium]
MASVRVAVYTLPRSAAGLTCQGIAAELLPVHQGQPGFLDHEVLTNTDEVISISRWQSREHATEGAVRVAAWVRGHLEGQVTLEQQYIGDTVGPRR